MLSDFDELDRYLIDTPKLFQQLSELKKINEWSLDGPPSEMVQNYISFNKQLATLYDNLVANLLGNHLGYQGLRYRIATSNLQQYVERTKNKKHIFLGFNALNKAESTIIQHILSSSESRIYWDIDSYFVNDPIHAAGHFIRKHLKNWPYHKMEIPMEFPENYLKKEQFQLIGIPKNISQTKYVGTLLDRLYTSDPKATIALVLADESLLPAILNAIPDTVGEVNITMGFPLERTVISDFFKALLEFYILQSDRGWQAKDALKLIAHPLSQYLLQKDEGRSKEHLKDQIIAHSYNYITCIQLEQWMGPKSILQFEDHPLEASQFLNMVADIIKLLKKTFQLPSQLIELEAIHLYGTLINQLKNLLRDQPFLEHLKNLKSILSELVALETINFKGSPVRGLQIMGMLETRALDFETIIITSVNEGILPAGKTNNSFIPYDLKGAFKMPTFRDKDAIYTYHFYRLLQRAKKVFITYNTEADVLEGGEKSRFISQLLADQNLKPFLSHTIEVPKVAIAKDNPKTVVKTPKLMHQIHRLAASGFSPTSLTTYIKNPYSFYKRYILGIQDIPNIIDSIAPNTFGTIIHDTLEVIYSPLVGTPLNVSLLESLKENVPQVTKRQFQQTLGSQQLDKGQLLIVFNVINKYILSVIDHDIAQAKHSEIEIISLEQKMQIPIQISGINVPINLKGTIDRIETKDGVTRIIDYKTGQTHKSDVVLVTPEELLEKESKSKAFQLLSYSLLYYESHAKVLPIKAGILPIKNINEGVLEFGMKTSPQARIKDTLISSETLNSFTLVLEQLISEILDPAIPFLDKERDSF